MKRLTYFVLTLISLLLLAGSARLLLADWQYDEIAPDVVQMMLHQVSTEQLRETVRAAIQADDPKEARLYLGLAQTFGYPLAAAEFESELQRLESPLNQARRTVNDFASGFLDGQGDSTASVAGAVTSDFTVVGDVRDLWEQYQQYAKGEPVNELIVSLAGVGVGLTAATLASAGAAGPVKSGVSTTKLAARTGHLTGSFQRFLLKQSMDVFDYKAFLLALRGEKSVENISQAAVRAYNPQAVDALTHTAGHINRIRKASSTADTLHLLQYVENGDDLIRLEKLAVQYGPQTRGILKLLGRSAIGTVRVLRKSGRLLVEIAGVLLSAIATLVTFSGFMAKDET